MAGITKISSVDGYYIDDGERVPKEGHLYFRGFDMQEIVKHCREENRFGFEEVAWLLIFGSLPSTELIFVMPAMTPVPSELRRPLLTLKRLK